MPHKTVPVVRDRRPAQRADHPPVVTPDFVNRVFYATSATHPSIRHTLAIYVTPAGTVRVSCTCPAGRHCRDGLKPVPCRHAKAVCALLADHGLVTFDGDSCRAVAQEAPVAA